MTRHSHSVWIACEPEEVFRILMDPAANCRWQSGVVRTWSTARGTADVGTTMTEVREVAGCRATIVYRVVQLEWPRHAVVEIVDGPLRGTASYTCTREAGGTRVTIASDAAPRGRWRCMAAAGRMVLLAELAMSCQRLKALVEHEETAPAIA